MSKKKTNLADALNKASGRNKTDTYTSIEPSATIEKSLVVKPSVPPSRVDKKAITGFFEPEVAKQLKMLALDRDGSIQSLLGEALNDLFIKYGKSPIAK